MDEDKKNEGEESVDLNIKKYVVKLNAEVHEFDSVRKCSKCGRDQYTKISSPISEYLDDYNVLRRFCIYCSRMWYEKCADGTDPKNI